MTMQAQAGPVRGAIGRKKKELMLADYDNPATHATPNCMLIERQLGWIVQTLHNPRLRLTERQCLLAFAGDILIEFLGRERARGVA